MTCPVWLDVVTAHGFPHRMYGVEAVMLCVSIYLEDGEYCRSCNIASLLADYVESLLADYVERVARSKLHASIA